MSPNKPRNSCGKIPQQQQKQTDENKVFPQATSEEKENNEISFLDHQEFPESIQKINQPIQSPQDFKQESEEQEISTKNQVSPLEISNAILVTKSSIVLPKSLYDILRKPNINFSLPIEGEKVEIKKQDSIKTRFNPRICLARLKTFLKKN